MDLDEEFLAIRDKLESYLYRIVMDREAAQDLVQDTYLKTKEKLHLFKGNSTFKTWVFAIGTNLAKDQQRVKQRWKLDAQDRTKALAEADINAYHKIVESFQSQPVKRYEIVEHINFCFNCIAKNLPLEQQLTIILKEIYHFKRKEIAQILDRSEGAVKHYLFNGRKFLQAKYENRCAMVNKAGPCYQCAEINDNLEGKPTAEKKIKALHFPSDSKAHLKRRFDIINQLNPLNSNGFQVENTILELLKQAIQEEK